MSQYESYSVKRGVGKGRILLLVLATLVLVLGWIVIFVRAATPDAGHTVVLVDKPFFWGNEGVRDEPVQPGLKFVFVTTDKIDVSMLPEQESVHFDDLMSKDGVPLDFDAVIRLQVTDAVKLIKSFGPNWYNTNVMSEFQNRVRQAVRKHGMNETAIDTTAIDSIDNEVSTAMEVYLKQAGLPIKLIQVTVGKANPPDAIKDQRIATATQQQRQRTEVERKLAEDARKDAETSRASADNAYRNAIGMNPDQFIELERIHMMAEACGGEKAERCTFIVGGDAAPIVAIPPSGSIQKVAEAAPEAPKN